MSERFSAVVCAARLVSRSDISLTLTLMTTAVFVLRPTQLQASIRLNRFGGNLLYLLLSSVEAPISQTYVVLRVPVFCAKKIAIILILLWIVNGQSIRKQQQRATERNMRRKR